MTEAMHFNPLLENLHRLLQQNTGPMDGDIKKESGPTVWTQSSSDLISWLSNSSTLSANVGSMVSDIASLPTESFSPQVKDRRESVDKRVPTGKKCPLFPPESIQDFKHVLYNLLAENYNNPQAETLLQPCSVEEGGHIRHGFQFNPRLQPEKKLPQLYALHIRKARLDTQDQHSVFIQDLHKFYLRACVELLSKYFEKKDKYTYLYDDMPLFEPGETLEQAEERLKSMKTRARKRGRCFIGM